MRTNDNEWVIAEAVSHHRRKYCLNNGSCERAQSSGIADLIYTFIIFHLSCETGFQTENILPKTLSWLVEPKFLLNGLASQSSSSPIQGEVFSMPDTLATSIRITNV